MDEQQPQEPVSRPDSLTPARTSPNPWDALWHLAVALRPRDLKTLVSPRAGSRIVGVLVLVTWLTAGVLTREHIDVLALVVEAGSVSIFLTGCTARLMQSHGWGRSVAHDGPPG